MPGSISLLDDRYLLAEQIGVGGFSEVWSGYDQVLDRPVAVKVLHAGYASHVEAVQRFRAEARHAGLLSHENVARIYDYGAPVPQHPPYLVMELIQGESLARALEREGPFGTGRTLDIIAQAAAGLQAAHEAGLVHRDIKPANLLLSKSGMVKITDFGISQLAGSVPVTQTGMIVGSAAYLAPERACGAQATVASDLYALGVVAYECLTGTRPFTGAALEVAHAHRHRPFPSLPSSVPPELARLVNELTAKNPRARPASAAEVASRAASLSAKRAACDSARLADRQARALATAAILGCLAHRLAAWQEGLRHLFRWRRLEQKFAVGLGFGAAATVLVGMLALSLLGAASRPAGLGAASTGSQSMLRASALPTTATRVDVDRRVLVGERVAVAREELERHGLKVFVRWRATAAQLPGRIVAVNPVGPVPAGTTVTLTGAKAPAAEPRSRPARHHPNRPYGPPGGGQLRHEPPGKGRRHRPTGPGHAPGSSGHGHHHGRQRLAPAAQLVNPTHSPTRPGDRQACLRPDCRSPRYASSLAPAP